MDIPSFHYYTDITPHQLQLLASVFIPPSLKNNLRKKKKKNSFSPPGDKFQYFQN